VEDCTTSLMLFQVPLPPVSADTAYHNHRVCFT
jgi:hypothetical protein